MLEPGSLVLRSVSETTPPVLPVVVSPLVTVVAVVLGEEVAVGSLLLLRPLSETVPSAPLVVGVLPPVVALALALLLDPGSLVAWLELPALLLSAVSSPQPGPSRRTDAKIHGDAVGWAMGSP